MPSHSFDELKSLVLLNRLAFGGGRKVFTLLEEGTPPSEILVRISAENFLGKSEELEKIKQRFDPERELEQCDQKGIRCLTIFDPDYPPLLKQIPDPPILLYLRGSILEADQAALAIVGSRLASFYGLTQARTFAKELAAAGLTIVSGLARGIDQAAHEAALEISFGRTIAVLGCGVDVIYPKENRKIYDALAERGAILSECALGTSPYAENFPRRNRIIAGLSLGALVVEAHSRSGSLITAHEAVDYGRDVFAIPGPVDQLTSRGTHRLLKEGAYLVEHPLDILEILAPQLWPLIQGVGSQKSVSTPREPAASSPPGCPKDSPGVADWSVENVEEERILIDTLKQGPLVMDEIVSRSSLAPSRLVSFLTKLELRGRIQKSRDGRFALK